MNIPKENALVTGDFSEKTIAIPMTWTETRDAILVEASKIEIGGSQEWLQSTVDTLRELKQMADIVNDMEEAERKPHNAYLKKLRAARDSFLAGVLKEKDRLVGMVNNFQRKAFEDQQAKDREAKRIADAAVKAQADANAEAERQRKLLELANPEEKAEIEDAMLDAELAAEEAELTQQSAAMELAIPTNKPRGLTTRVKYDFEITNWLNLAKHAHLLFIYHKPTETIKFNRAGLLKELNKDTGHEWLPEDTQQSVNHTFGLRVFVSVKTNLR